MDVTSEVSGNVAWVGVDVGDTVSRGQALVRLDTALAASGARQSAAALSAAEARYGQTRVGLQLTRDQTASEVRQAESSMDTARNRLRQARATATLTRNRVEDAIAQARIGVRVAVATRGRQGGRAIAGDQPGAGARRSGSARHSGWPS